MTAIFIHTPLEFSAFPTVLLIEGTMLRAGAQKLSLDELSWRAGTRAPTPPAMSSRALAIRNERQFFVIG